MILIFPYKIVPPSTQNDPAGYGSSVQPLTQGDFTQPLSELLAIPGTPLGLAEGRGLVVGKGIERLLPLCKLHRPLVHRLL